MLARLDRQLERVTAREQELNDQIATHAQDYAVLSDLSAQLQVVSAEREELELEWLEVAEALE